VHRIYVHRNLCALNFCRSSEKSGLMDFETSKNDNHGHHRLCHYGVHSAKGTDHNDFNRHDTQL
jgi:hypothetical protein